MDNYLVLHFDLEFIAAVVWQSNGNHFSIENENEEFLWLYFFNDTYQNRITYGKSNRKHFYDPERDNYFGDFYKKILDRNEKFLINGIERPVIDLLDNSGILKLFFDKYNEVYPDDQRDIIPTLITFSQTIGEQSKQKIVEYLTSKNFKVDSYTLPLAELATYYYWKKSEITFSQGNVVIFLCATNSTLHLSKLYFTDDYYLQDEKSLEKYKGKGFDPRRKVIIDFVIYEVNKYTSIFSSRDELEEEGERFESTAEEWLKGVDAAGEKKPFCIKGVSLSPAPGMLKDVLVNKRQVDEGTGVYINDLISIYSDYASKPRKFVNSTLEEKPSIASVILLGECFNNDLVRIKFNQQVNESVIIAPTNMLHQILKVYPEIDIVKYSDSDERIRTFNEFEEIAKIRISAKRSLNDVSRLITERKYYRAKEILNRVSELNINDNEISKTLDESNKLIESRIDDFTTKKGKADQHFIKRAWDDARVAYKEALIIMPEDRYCTERLTIIDGKDKEEKSFKELVEQADKSFDRKTWDNAEKLYNEALAIISGDIHCREQLSLISSRKKDHKLKTDQADKFFDNKAWNDAEEAYKEILSVFPDDGHSAKQLTIISDKKKRFDELIAQASISFDNKKWSESEDLYNEALKIIPDQKLCHQRLSIISEKIGSYKELVSRADTSFDNKALDDSEESYGRALKINPDDRHCRERLSIISDKKRVIKDLIYQADKSYAKNAVDEAEENYNKALRIVIDNKHCIERLTLISEKKKSFNNSVNQAKVQLNNKEWNIAENLFKEALKNIPDDKYCQDKLEEIAEKLEDFNKDIKQADRFFGNREWEEAKTFYSKALVIKPKDEYCASQLAKIKIEINKRIRVSPPPLDPIPGKGRPVLNYRRLFIVVSVFTVTILLSFAVVNLINHGGEKGSSKTDVTESKTDIPATDQNAMDPEKKKNPDTLIEDRKQSENQKEQIQPVQQNQVEKKQMQPQQKEPQTQQPQSKQQTQSQTSSPVGTDSKTNQGLENGVYEGTYLDGKMNGKGKYTFTRAGTIFKGEQDESKVSEGDYLVGTWKNGSFSKGDLFDKNKNLLTSINRRIK
jgi:tetratricopeptide (TPR) repeat protein